MLRISGNFAPLHNQYLFKLKLMIRYSYSVIFLILFSLIVACKSEKKSTDTNSTENTDTLQLTGGDTISFFGGEEVDDSPVVVGEGELYLTFNPITGKTYSTLMETTSRISQTVNGEASSNIMNLSASNNLKVEQPNSDGYFIITSSVKNFKSKVTQGTIEVAFESGKKSADQDADMLRQIMDCYIGMPVTIEMDKNARILSMKGTDAIQKKIQTELGNDAVMVAQQMSDLNQEVLNSFVAFPRKAIKPGDTWITIDSVDMGGVPTIMKNVFTLKSFDSELANISVNSTFSVDKDYIRSIGGTGNEVTMTGGQNGTMQVDSHSGWTRSAELKQDVKMHIEDQGQLIDVSITGNTTFKII